MMWVMFMAEAPRHSRRGHLSSLRHRRKQVLTRASTIAGAVALSSVLTSASAAQEPTGGPASTVPVVPVVEASGRGEVRVAPDRATVSVGVETRAATAAAASRENARIQRAIIDTVRALGVPANQITTVDFSVYPEQVYDPQRGDQRPRITGYVVRNSVRVELRRIDQVGALLDAALAKGANGINGLYFFSSEEEAVRRRALADAVADARADAEALARAAGRCLGDIIDLTTVVQGGPRPLMRERAAMSAAADATPIEPGEQTLEASVTGRWRLITPASGGSCPR
jgi:uncharacterized protein YggE